MHTVCQTRKPLKLTPIVLVCVYVGLGGREVSARLIWEMCQAPNGLFDRCENEL